MKKTTQGFTLIELLVVIAIIGILSSIVIASLNSARTKGAVSAAKGGAAQVRTQAEVYYDSSTGGAGVGYATGTCGVVVSTAGVVGGTATGFASTGCMFADSTTQSQLKQIAANSASSTMGTVSTDYQKWAVSTILKGSGNIHYCIDNSGNTKEQSTATIAKPDGTCS